jgi:uncharacterized protein (DUF2147 family)
VLKAAVAANLALACILASPLEARPTVQGLWLTDDGKGVARIAACGAQMCGWISQILDKGQHVPETDINNPDARLRSRPLLGLPILSGFNYSGSAWRNGRAYDPKSGRSYRSSLMLSGDNVLTITGCILFICQSLHWKRVQ